MMHFQEFRTIATRTITAALIAAVSVTAAPARANSAGTLEAWLRFETQKSQEGLLRNIAPAGAAAGSVVASPSRHTPDYFFHWVRDAALVMDTVLSMHDREPDARKRQGYLKLLRDFTEFSRKNQLTPNRSGSPHDTGLGEPKFHADGRAYDADWGRPQNDGPALRAITLIRYSRILLSQGQDAYVRSRLYDSRIPTDSVIKADLEFVAHHWGSSSFDLWEEVRGHHFYTRMVQRRALVEGAKFAEQMGDGGAAAYYRAEAKKLEGVIAHHWNAGAGYIQTTLARSEGLSYKGSNLDISVVLAALHAAGDDGFYSIADDRVLATAERLEREFKYAYAINERSQDWEGLALAPAIGRYPEDQYNGGYGAPGGNPWVLATAAMAELYHRVADAVEARGHFSVNTTNAAFAQNVVTSRRFNPGQTLGGGSAAFGDLVRGLRSRGDQYFARVRFHANPDGTLSEQMNRDSGVMHGAVELTWSYASLLTAAWAR